MSKIAIIGANSLGTAIAKILLCTTDLEIAFIDPNEEDLSETFVQCSEIQRPTHRIAFSPSIPVETFTAHNKEQLEATLRSLKPLAVVNVVLDDPIEIAQLAFKIGVNYVDLSTADVTEVFKIPVSRLTFVPQAGLSALTSLIGLSLLEDINEPLKLQLWSGIIPQVAIAPAFFVLPFPAEELVGSYTSDAIRKNQGVIEQVPSLDEHEFLYLDGTRFESFTAFGICSDLRAFDMFPSVEHKVIRLPGHLEFMQKLLSKVQSFDDGVDLVDQTLSSSLNDFVLISALATDTSGYSSSAWLKFYPCEELGISAFELVSAGVVAGIIELIQAGDLEAGVLNISQIPFDKLFKTASCSLIFTYNVND